MKIKHALETHAIIIMKGPRTETGWEHTTMQGCCCCHCKAIHLTPKARPVEVAIKMTLQKSTMNYRQTITLLIRKLLK